MKTGLADFDWPVMNISVEPTSAVGYGLYQFC
jgi:hypothetical protein